MQDLHLPKRLFAAGEEPTGFRVNLYQRMVLIHQLKKSLSPPELKFMMQSSFEKFLDFPCKPAWSACFGLFLLSRQLVTKNKYEIWVIFAGSPIRFSLREFKIITGIPCGKYPDKYPDTVPKKRQESSGVSTSFYDIMFGGEEDVTIQKVLTMLRKKTVKDSKMRLWMACLVLIDGILVPTQHFPKVKVYVEHSEMTEDLDFFPTLPWGRLSFEAMMKSIKDRDLTRMITSHIAVQGLFIALQWVVVEEVPDIQEGPSIVVDVDSDSDEDASQSGYLRIPLKLNQARELDAACEVEVTPIICSDIDFDPNEEDLSWCDEEEDNVVDNLVKLVEERFEFEDNMFVGGCKPSHIGLS